MNGVVKARLQRRRHIILEQPLGSEMLDQPELADVRKYLQDGVLVKVRFDGCMVGHVNPDT